MPPLFNPRLVNPPTGDPTLFAPFFFQKRALIFDLGDLSALSPRDLLKISHVFVTHTHMDHFIGFDHLLRVLLGREQTLHLFGPEGFLANIEGKLAGYTWNLVENYADPLSILATELRSDRTIECRYDCANRFRPESRIESKFNPLLVKEPNYSVSTAILEHDIACLGFSLKEEVHVNIRKDVLDSMDLTPGPWLHELKEALFHKRPPDTVIAVPGRTPDEERKFLLEELAEKLVVFTEGQKFAYITDATYSEENESKIIELAKNSDHLYIEAPFLEKDRRMAAEKRHLTAFQAGRIAAMAGAARFSLFHFSPRYEGCYEQFETEAMEAYNRFA